TRARPPLGAVLPIVEIILSRGEADASIQVVISPDRLAEHTNGALAWLQFASHDFHEGRLAGAVRTQQTRNTDGHGDGDVVQPRDLPIPLREMLGGNRGHATISTARIRRSRIQ